MNKNDLVSSVADGAGMSKTDAAEAVEGVFGAITNELRSGGEVRVVGFGTFSVANRKATTGRNPRTGETVNVARKSVPFFKVGKDLRLRLNVPQE